MLRAILLDRRPPTAAGADEAPVVDELALVGTGDRVTLRRGRVEVVVAVIAAEGDRFEGRVERFRGSPGDTFQGVMAGDRIRFESAHVFAIESP